MTDWFKKWLLLGLGLAAAGKEQVEKLVNEWVQTGELTRDEAKEMIRRLTERGDEEKTKLKEWIGGQLKELLRELDVPTKEDLRQLEERIAKLEQRSE